MKPNDTMGPPYFCYIIENDRGTTYNGYTNNLKRRLNQHNGVVKGGARATRNKGPWKYIFVVTSNRWRTVSRIMQLEWSIRYPTRKKPRPREYNGGLGRIRSLDRVFNQTWISQDDFDTKKEDGTIRYYVHEDYINECETVLSNCCIPSNDFFNDKKIESFVEVQQSSFYLKHKSSGKLNFEMAHQKVSVQECLQHLIENEDEYDDTFVKQFRRLLNKFKKNRGKSGEDDDVMTMFSFTAHATELVEALTSDVSTSSKIQTYDTLCKAIQTVDIIKQKLHSDEATQLYDRFYQEKKRCQNENYRQKKGKSTRPPTAAGSNNDVGTTSGGEIECPQEHEEVEEQESWNQAGVNEEIAGEHNDVYDEFEAPEEGEGDESWTKEDWDEWWASLSNDERYYYLQTEDQRNEVSKRLEEVEAENEVLVEKMNKIFMLLPKLGMSVDQIDIINIAIR